ncbi:hypothetical protein G2W53_006613 [Senna tora]|uniref:Uncharacterized protein n=1 Tax=Senna tora TaxID=362788 RepID=A0A834X4H2_9FABA|nr:hypothetical protein G2W53_006613 [Senna tora]
MEVLHHPSTTTCSTSYDAAGTSIPYFLPQERNHNNNVLVSYPSMKKGKSTFRIQFKKLYSNRVRGRSGPLRSLARKLGRFKVRIILVQGTGSK